jgi:hypothetical protein
MKLYILHLFSLHILHVSLIITLSIKQWHHQIKGHLINFKSQPISVLLQPETWAYLTYV